MILVLDTCTERLVVATRVGGTDRIVNVDSRGNHARDLLEAVDRVTGGQKPEAIGVAVGPGSFTGVRIGLTSAKGLADGWGVPLVGLDNLGAMASAAARLRPGRSEARLPIIDARKQKFYGGLWGPGGVLSEAADRSAADWIAVAQAVWAGPVLLTGYQPQVLAAGRELPPNWEVLATPDWAPGLLDQAEVEVASQRWLPAHAGPRYLRLSEAEEARLGR